VTNDFLTLSKSSQEILLFLARQWVELPAELKVPVHPINWDELKARQFVDRDHQFTAYGAIYTNIGLGVKVRPELIAFVRAREQEMQAERNYYYTLGKLRTLLNTWIDTDKKRGTQRVNLVLPNELHDFASQLEKLKAFWDTQVEETMKADEKARAVLYSLLEHA
jgi:hypothetical protein